MCVICGLPYTEKTHAFNIHHLDGNAANTVTNNLVLMNSDCHRQVEGEAKRILTDKKNGAKTYIIRDFVDTMEKMVASEKGYEIKRCPYCSGVGGRVTVYDKTCPVCNGTGENKIELPAKLCVHCSGYGSINIYRDRCPVCKGSGWRTLK